MADKNFSYKNRTRVSSYGGVYTVTLFTPPQDCGGKCVFCPKSKNFPNSYISNASLLFAESVCFDSAPQFKRFSKAFLENDIKGPIPIEVIILGGSFCSFSHEFRLQYINSLYDEMCGCKNSTSEDRENGLYRCSILTVEARPDQITSDECEFLRSIGVSKVEIGVQHLNDKILAYNKRGHDSNAVRNATMLLKQYGFKVGYHIMIGLPSSSFKDDSILLEKLLWDIDFSPDFLKIYPCVLLKDKSYQPLLHALYKKTNWRPPTISYTKNLLTILGNNVPPFVRISRVQRFFPQHLIQGEYQKGLRENVNAECLCVRCREAGKRMPKIPLTKVDNYKIIKTINGNDRHYEIVTQDNILLALARIYIIDNGNALLREIHTYGYAAQIGNCGHIQGRGIGRCLMEKIEVELSHLKCKALYVNAAFGARSFFRSIGYKDSNLSLLYKILHEKTTGSSIHS